MRSSPGQVRLFFNRHSSPGFLHPSTTGLSTRSPWNCPPCPQLSIISATAHACRSGRRSPRAQRAAQAPYLALRNEISEILPDNYNRKRLANVRKPAACRRSVFVCYLTNLSPATVWLKLSKSYKIDQTDALNLLRALVCSSSPSEQR